jgi:hypothetical protein
MEQWVYNGVHSTLVRVMRSYWKEKYRLRSRELRLTTVGDRRADHATPLYPQKLALNFADSVAAAQTI